MNSLDSLHINIGKDLNQLPPYLCLVTYFLDISY